jgi:mRNA interferase MazF
MTSRQSSAFKAGSVVLVPFPFSDLTLSKKRPCVVLSKSDPKGLPAHLILAMITSNLSGLDFPNDIKVKDLETAGLPKPSIIRLDKMVTVDSNIVIRTLGDLAEKDRVALKKKLKIIFEELI